MQININTIYPLKLEEGNYDARAKCMMREYTYKMLLLKGENPLELIDLKAKL